MIDDKLQEQTNGGEYELNKGEEHTEQTQYETNPLEDDLNENENDFKKEVEEAVLGEGSQSIISRGKTVVQFKENRKQVLKNLEETVKLAYKNNKVPFDKSSPSAFIKSTFRALKSTVGFNTPNIYEDAISKYEKLEEQALKLYDETLSENISKKNELNRKYHEREVYLSRSTKLEKDVEILSNEINSAEQDLERVVESEETRKLKSLLPQEKSNLESLKIALLNEKNNYIQSDAMCREYEEIVHFGEKVQLEAEQHYKRLKHEKELIKAEFISYKVKDLEGIKAKLKHQTISAREFFDNENKTILEIRTRLKESDSHTQNYEERANFIKDMFSKM